jgi:RNA polymerase sigma-70 factor (ECF subfamily)
MQPLSDWRPESESAPRRGVHDVAWEATDDGRRAREAGRAFVQGALAGDEAALAALVRRLTPVVQARAARALLRAGRGAGPRLRQELKDLVQEVFLALFEGQGRILRSWDPERGLSLENFVGLVTERQVLSILRSGKRDPWRLDPTLDSELDSVSPEASPEAAAASKQALEQLLDRLRGCLSPLGWRLFELLYLRETSVEEVERETGLSSAAVYAWRSRLRRLVRGLVDAPESGNRGSGRIPRAGES